MAFTVVRRKCPACGKMAVQKSTSEFGTVLCIELECGHTITRDVMAPPDAEEIVSSDGRALFEFQIKTVEFIEKAGGQGIVAHEMGLGKTVIDQALMIRNKNEM